MSSENNRRADPDVVYRADSCGPREPLAIRRNDLCDAGCGYHCCSNLFFIPAKARDYVFTGVGLSVCLFVTTITKYNVDGSGQNFLGRFLGGKASPSSFSVTIASRVWRLLSKKAVNRGFFPM